VGEEPRVDAARQAQPDRPFADEADAGGVGEERLDLFGRLVDPHDPHVPHGALAVAGQRHVPPALDAQLAVLPARQVPGRHLLHLAVDRPRRAHEAVAEHLLDRLRVDRPAEVAARLDGPERRREHQAPSVLPDEQRLLPQAIAHEEQLALGVVPHREGEHPVQSRGAGGGAMLGDRVQDDLGVALRTKDAPAPFELAAQPLRGVALAVVDDAPAPVVDGLVAAGDVDDGEAAHAEGDAGRVVEALPVRASMPHRRHHAPDLVTGRGAAAHLSGNAAHALARSLARW
jgi:hypothetical protein